MPFDNFDEIVADLSLGLKSGPLSSSLQNRPNTTIPIKMRTKMKKKCNLQFILENDSHSGAGHFNKSDNNMVVDDDAERK